MTETIDEAVRRIVATCPPLTEGQKRRIAALFRGERIGHNVTPATRSVRRVWHGDTLLFVGPTTTTLLRLVELSSTHITEDRYPCAEAARIERAAKRESLFNYPDLPAVKWCVATDNLGLLGVATEFNPDATPYNITPGTAG